MDNLKAAVDLATEISKQLITLSTGIVALTITFAKDFLGGASRNQLRILYWSWGCYIITIVAAIWHLSAITGNLLNAKNGVMQWDSSKTPAYLQLLAFLAGTILLVVFAAKAVKPRAPDDRDE
jgi:hypothetical protein